VTHRPIYLDSSALVKLVFDEVETAALQRFLRKWPVRASSAIAAIEVRRLARRVDDQAVDRCARDVMNRLHVIGFDPGLLRHAGELEPRTLGSLDAIHLATALSLLPDLAGIVVYDSRLSKAAAAAGLQTFAPA
jgi:predicted nucleic acid-binding protein